MPQFYLSDWFTRSRLPAIYTCVFPYMEMNAANVAQHKIFPVKQVSSTKKNASKKADLANYPRKKYEKLWTRPSQKQQKSHKVRNEIV